jgi:hypothetical protein
MLKIKKIRKYAIARYPHEIYYYKPYSFTSKLLKRILAPTFILTLLGSIAPEPIGAVGPPPVAPDMVTENEARAAIEEVFARNNINLKHDVKYLLKYGEDHQAELELDGYNDSLGIGYEYLDWKKDKDFNVFTPDILTAIENQKNGSGPFIEVIRPLVKDRHSEENLENLIQEFIDSLKARGII